MRRLVRRPRRRVATNVMICRRITVIAVHATWFVPEAPIAQRGAAFVLRGKRCVMACARRWIPIRIIVVRAIDPAGMMTHVWTGIARADVTHRLNIAMVRVST